MIERTVMTDKQLIGRKLDAVIASLVMGQTMCDGWYRDYDFKPGDERAVVKTCSHVAGSCYPHLLVGDGKQNLGGPPHYSESIEAAMHVVQKMQSLGFSVVLESEHPKIWECEFSGRPNGVAWAAESLPEAICRAALAVAENAR